MNLLFPAMLAGLAGLGVPVVFHLIARHRFPVQAFPAVRLLRYERRANVFAWRLVDLRQLLLRLLVLLLLVLAMARLFSGWLSSAPAPRNLVVVLDTSASMAMEVPDPEDENGRRVPLFTVARRRARALLAGIAAPSHAALLAGSEGAGVRTGLSTDPAAALGALDGLAVEDGRGTPLVGAVAEACDLLANRREIRSQIVVLTDLRATALERRDQEELRRIRAARDAVGERLEIAFVDVGGGEAGNRAVTHAAVLGDVMMGDDLHVVSEVQNASDTGKSVQLRMTLGGRKEPLVKEVSLAPGGRAFVDLTARVDRALQTFARTGFQESDELPHDDGFDVPVSVASPRRVLIVHPGREAAEAAVTEGLERLGGAAPERGPETAESEEVVGATVLRYVLNPARELGQAASTGILSTVVTVEALAGQPLSKYDIIFLYDVSSLPDGVLADLSTYVGQGRALVFICAARTEAVHFNRTLAAGSGERPALAAAPVGNDVEREEAVGLEDPKQANLLLAPFRDRLQGDLSVVRFSRLRDLRTLPADAEVLVRAADGTPLIVSAPRGEGRTVLFTFGLELDRSTLARTRVFPVLMWRLVDYLTGRLEERRPDVLSAGTPTVLDVSETAFAFEDELALSRAGASQVGGEAEPLQTLPIRPGRTVVLDELPAGRYRLHKPRRGGGVQVMSYARQIAVNPDPAESSTERVGADDLAAIFGPAARLVPADELERLVVRGAEWWLPLVVLLFCAYAAEALIGWRDSVRRERERGGEAPA
jgi:hypothetical protein